MRTKRIMIVCALIAAMLLGMTAGAFAASNLEKIQAFLNRGIIIKYNDKAYEYEDPQVGRVYPITYNGTTYLSLRAVADMLDLGISWDQATQTVLLGKVSGGVNLLEKYTPYQYLPTPLNLRNSCARLKVGRKDIGGVSVDRYLLYDQDSFWGWNEDAALFNIEGKYNTLTLKIYSTDDTVLVVKGDNDTVLYRGDVVGSKAPQTVTVDLKGTIQLELWVGSSDIDWDGDAYIFDAILE